MPQTGQNLCWLTYEMLHHDSSSTPLALCTVKVEVTSHEVRDAAEQAWRSVGLCGIAQMNFALSSRMLRTSAVS